MTSVDKDIEKSDNKGVDKDIEKNISKNIDSNVDEANGHMATKRFAKIAWKKLLLTAVFLVVAALCLTWLLQLRYFSNNVTLTWDFVFGRTKVFMFNAWLMLLMLTVVVSIVGSVFRGTSIATVLVLIVGYIHMNKYASRGAPLLPEDFQLASEAASLSKFVSIDSLITLVISIVAALVVGELLHHFCGKFFIGSRNRKHAKASFAQRHLIVPRVVTLLAALALLFVSTDFIRNHTGEKYQDIAFLDSTFTAWDQNMNYNDNGFIIGFLYNCSSTKLAAPADYDAETIAAIKTHAEALAAADDNPSLADQDYNIVIIMNESFIDFTQVEEYYPYSGGDVTPNLHRIMATYPSGYVYSPDYGGGTANIEFEAITGFTNYWIGAVPYVSLVPFRDEVPSVGSFAKENGYVTSAIHAYSASMYKRNIALPRLGFDTFISADQFRHAEHDGNSVYINDRSIYQEILDLLGGEQKQLVLGITMQNHTPYPTTNYDTLDFTLDVDLGDAEREASIETYLQTIHNADAYMGEFLAALSELERNTVVLLFGDHAPGLLTELANSSDLDLLALAHTTPYFIYANFDLPAATTALPTTTPNCLMNTLYDTLAVQKPDYYYLIDEVCQSTPILTSYYYGAAGLDEDEILNDYKLLTYDFVAGEDYFGQ